MKRKINVMMERPKISDEELGRFRDFDALLAKHQQVQADKIKLWKIIVPVVVILGGTLYGILNSLPEQTTTTVLFIDKDSVSESLPLQSESSRIDSVIVEKRERLSAPGNMGDPEILEDKPAVPKKEFQVPVTVDKVPADSVQESTPSASVQKMESVYVQAEPVDGYAALYEYFSRELIYPKESVKDSIEGVLTVTFLINKEGKPEKIKTSGSLGKTFDLEGIRLIESMPAWKPATINGKPVTSKLSLPLTFQLRTRNK